MAFARRLASFEPAAEGDQPAARATQLHTIEAIPAVTARQVLDPTGCGDAFRGGLLYGIEKQLGWATTGRLASLMGALKIEHQGPQNYAPTRAEINERFKQAFGYDLQ